MKYIEKDKIENLINYKYHGEDYSLTYKYFLSPLA